MKREKSLIEVRILITTIAAIALIIQAVAAFFDIFTMRKPVTLSESLFNDFVLISSLCSLSVAAIFILIYNLRNRFLKNKIVNLLFLYIAFYAAYVHLYQIFLQKDFILTSCILLPIDCYIAYKSIKLLHLLQGNAFGMLNMSGIVKYRTDTQCHIAKRCPYSSKPDKNIYN